MFKNLWRTSRLYGSSQVDSSFDGDVVGSLEEGPLQEESDEEQHCQHVRILQEFLGWNEIDAKKLHL